MIYNVRDYCCRTENVEFMRERYHLLMRTYIFFVIHCNYISVVRKVLARLRKAELEEPVGKEQADHVVVNDDFDRTVDEMIAIIDRERCR